jgi:hypothetical protein
MTNDERIKGLEDALTRLSNIVEHRLGAYADDRNQVVRDEGDLIHGWARAAQEHRAGS